MGPQLTPFSQFVLKINSSCNLACNYCYMYESADPVAAGGTVSMQDSTIAQVARRIADHAADHRLSRVAVIFHGGEPLLSGADSIARAARVIRGEAGAGVTVDCSVQTNGVLLTERCVGLLADAGIRVGVSLDGDRVANDRHRRFRDGRSSAVAVRRGIEILRSRPAMYAGLLSVIDLANDPRATYEALLAHEPPAIDFLLPHGNWSHPPPGRPPDDSTPYGDWLIAVFDRWYDAPVQETRVRLFDQIIRGLVGFPSRSESIGLSPVSVLVVNTDGALEQVDTLRTAYPGAVATSLNVFDHPFDEALIHPDVVRRQGGLAALSEVCRECPVGRTCGGGYYPHRYRSGAGFDNPSVFCPDLFRLIRHIGGRVRADVASLKSGAPLGYRTAAH
ncbi:FxsB family radical SAM/SPASM domain protein [Dactylosporangium matsuzakiense]|nr:FxsB family radical SAM/SPASM domain protein [Dactylosporangium matsuzakiense]